MSTTSLPTPAATTALPQVPCGKHGLHVSRIGLGTMGMTAFYVTDATQHEEEGLRTIASALELGCNFFDTAWIYQSVGPDGCVQYNESLLGRAIAQHGRHKFVIATKCGLAFEGGQLVTRATEAAIRQQLQESLARLGTDYVDLYYQHRQDPAVPIEEVARVLEALRVEGKIRYIGFSEISAGELRRAAAICPVSAIQMEYSLQTRVIEAAVLPVARELGVAVVAYSPLARGLLSRTFRSTAELAAGDWRGTMPRLQGDNAAHNFSACERFEAKAASLGIAPATLALAWVLSRGDDIIPIPGCKAVERLKQNMAAAHVQLSAAEWAEIEALVGEGKGERYQGNLHFEARDV